MKYLFFDPAAGASGDMIMGCLLDIGADPRIVKRAIESVGCSIELTKQKKNHIVATRALIVSERKYHSIGEAESILRQANLEDSAKKKALRAMEIIAEAESKVHGVPKEEIRFHELGALDALADIAGGCAALQSLQIERVMSKPVHAGGGYIQTAHGLLPVPGPAALEILRSNKIPWMGGPVNEELLTPTGAALLAVMVDEFCSYFPQMIVEQTGYGAGKMDYGIPNFLRGLIAQTPQHQGRVEKDRDSEDDRVVQLESNVDDVTGEVMGYLMERLLLAGALDVSVLPALMKKGRSGLVIRVIAKHEDMNSLSTIIMRETGTLGVRVFPSIHRLIAKREEATVELEIDGKLLKARIKISQLDGEILTAKPEYEDCRRIAEQTNQPLRKIIKYVEEAWQKS